MTDLRECPFCGARRAVVTTRVGGVTSCVRCPACGFQTLGSGPGIDFCVKAWNAPRHYDAKLSEAIAAAKALADFVESVFCGAERVEPVAHLVGWVRALEGKR